MKKSLTISLCSSLILNMQQQLNGCLTCNRYYEIQDYCSSHQRQMLDRQHSFSQDVGNNVRAYFKLVNMIVWSGH